MKYDQKQKILNEILDVLELGDKNFYALCKKYISNKKSEIDDYKHKEDLIKFQYEIYGLHRAILHLNIKYKKIECPSSDFPDFCVIDDSGFLRFVEVTSNSYENTVAGKYDKITHNLDKFLIEKEAGFRAEQILDISPNDDRLRIEIRRENIKTNSKIRSNDYLDFCVSFLRLNKVDNLNESDKKILCGYIGKYVGIKRDNITEYRQDFKIKTIFPCGPVDEVYGNAPEKLQIGDISDRINDKFKRYENRTADGSIEQVRSKILVIDTINTRWDVLLNPNGSFKDLLLNSCDALKKKHNYFDHVLIICPKSTVDSEGRKVYSLGTFWIIKYSTEENKWIYLNN